MLTLQLKRTERSIDDSSIGSLVLAKGEPFYLIEDTRRLLFIGDGETQLSNFYENRKFISITNFVTADQILSINASALPEGLATIAQLEQLEQEINGSIGNINTALDSLNSKVDTTKLFYATCNTSANITNKVIQIDISDAERTSDFTGVSFVVRFEYANSADNPVLQITDLLNHPIIEGPIYIGNQPLSGVFNWIAGDTIIFTYYDNKMNMAGTSASQRLASWCADNDATLINGGMIATGSITADQIASHSITADQIAVGSLPASVLDQQFSAALNNLNFIEQQAASSKQVICTCDTDGDEIIKEVYLNGDAALSIGIINDAPMYGTSLVIKFTHGNTSVNGCSLRLILDGFPFPAAANLVPAIGYYDDNNLFHGLEPDQELNWLDDDTRVLVYDGAHWIIQPSTGYLRRAAEWCLSNNQTFIQGGSIIAGRISCAQLEAGTIDTGKISLSYYSLDSDGNLINYGGFNHYDGSTTTETTKGVIMYGSDRDHYNFVVTNKGIAVNAGNAYIRGYGDQLHLHSYEEFYLNTDDSVSSGNIVIGRSANTTYFRSGNINITGSMTLLNSILNVKNLPKASDTGFDLNNLAVGDFWIDTSSNNTLKVKL